MGGGEGRVASAWGKGGGGYVGKGDGWESTLQMGPGLLFAKFLQSWTLSWDNQGSVSGPGIPRAEVNQQDTGHSGWRAPQTPTGPGAPQLHARGS